MKVLLTVASLLPSYGGPAFSVSGIAKALSEAGAEVGVWAPDQSAATTPLLSPQCSVMRVIGSESEALRQFGRPDILHDNGIWLRHNHRLAVLAARKSIHRVVSVRGMLEPWALGHKRLKKTVAWRLFQERDLKRATRHHATAETEAQNIRRLGLGVPAVVIPNGVNLPEQEINPGRPQVTKAGDKSPRTALFLSRIHPKKGLPMLIEAWARLRPEGWILRIAGPDESGHQRMIEKAVNAAGLNAQVLFSGPLHGKPKDAAFSEAEILVLPTHSENFGVVIAEALAHGLPTLTTTAAPWSILREYGCGWSVEPNTDALMEGLRVATSLPAETLTAMGAEGRRLVKERFCWKMIASQMLSLYADALTQ